MIDFLATSDTSRQIMLSELTISLYAQETQAAAEERNAIYSWDLCSKVSKALQTQPKNKQAHECQNKNIYKVQHRDFNWQRILMWERIFFQICAEKPKKTRNNFTSFVFA